MRIAVDTRNFFSGHTDDTGQFKRNIFMYLAQQYTSHEFIFLFDQHLTNEYQFPANVRLEVVGPVARHRISSRWWFDVKVPMVLRRLKADVFICAGTSCSLMTRVPQVWVIPDPSFFIDPAFVQKIPRPLYQRFTRRLVNAANLMVTHTEAAKQRIVEITSVKSDKIWTITGAPGPGFKPLDWHEREQVKDEITQGCEYFVFPGAIHPRNNVLNLLKAFSLFKKRQKSNMKLVLAGTTSDAYPDFNEKLATYKYRQDVVVTGLLQESKLQQVIAAAYAMVYPSYINASGIGTLQALQCRVPVIASQTTAMEEILGEAALYADPADAAAIAEQMKFIYTNENKRNQLIEKGSEVILKYSWPVSAQQMWLAIQQAVSG